MAIMRLKTGKILNDSGKDLVFELFWSFQQNLMQKFNSDRSRMLAHYEYISCSIIVPSAQKRRIFLQVFWILGIVKSLEWCNMIRNYFSCIFYSPISLWPQQTGSCLMTRQSLYSLAVVIFLSIIQHTIGSGNSPEFFTTTLVTSVVF